MIIIGEKINGAIPSVAKAIAEKNDGLICELARRQTAAGADFIDCAASTEPAIEYDTMCRLIDLIQQETETPICLDSPDASLLARLLNEGRVLRPGMINSVNEEGTKCETIFPIIAGTDWSVIGLTCDESGIPADPVRRVEIAKRIIDKADHFGVALGKLYLDPCVMALATTPSALSDLVYCINAIHELSPEVKVAAAVSNISYNMPARKYINLGCMVNAVQAGLDAAIMDPTSDLMMGAMYAAAALSGEDKGGRKYNRAYRKGVFGRK